MKRVLISLAILVAALLPASADEFEIMGLGMQTCGKFAELYRATPDLVENAFFAWAQGFMSGLNLASVANSRPAKNGWNAE